MQRLRLYTSGVEVPTLGSTKDKILRRFMDHETKRRLKTEQISWTTAYMVAGEPNQKILKGLWEELVELEFGGEVDTTQKAKQDDEKRWLAEYEAMKSRDVKLVRKSGSLSVEGL